MTIWRQLLDVQELDTKLRQLDHRSAQLPQRPRLAEIDDLLAEQRAAVGRVESDKAVLVKQQRKIEDEIATVEAKKARDEAQLYDGHSSDAGMLQALQDEIASYKRRISSLEDDELELMVQVEPLDAELEALAQHAATLDAEAIELTAQLAEDEATIDAERAVVLEGRTVAVAGVDAALLSRYETVRDRLGGTAIALLEHGVCKACNMKLSAVEIDRIKHLPADEEVQCEDCTRFLVHD